MHTIEKQKLRAGMKEALRALGVAQISAQSASACKNAMALPAYQAAATLLCYLAMPMEADPSALVRRAYAEGKRVAFPYCLDGGRMIALAPKAPGDLVQGAHGIWAPAPERSEEIPPHELDAILVPGLAFDAQGGRLGWGAGYYDRYLAESSACRIGFCLQCQMLDAVPMEAHDLRMQIVVTNARCFAAYERE